MKRSLGSMALLLQEGCENTRWGLWKLEENMEELLVFLPGWLREEYRQEAETFTSPSRQTEWLAVRALLSQMAGSDKRISYASNGKPCLADGSYYISISHTRGYVAIMLSTEGPVGIDIEQFGSRVHRVANRFLNPEDEVVPDEGSEDTTCSLLLHWSAKEAVYKRIEHPDADLRKLKLSPFFPQSAGNIVVQECSTAVCEQFSVSYRVFQDFVLTWTPAFL